MGRRTASFDAVAWEITPGQLAAILDMELRGKGCRCPFHEDSNPSANIYEADDGRTVFKCFQCDTTLTAVNLAARVWDIDAKEAGVRLADHIGLDTARLGGWAKRGKRGRPPRKAGPGRIPAELHQDPSLGLGEIALYSILTCYNDTYPTYAELADYGCCSESTVRRGVNKLQDTGWVPRRQRRYGNEYFPLWTPLQGGHNELSGGSEAGHNEHAENAQGVHPRTDGSVHPRTDESTVGGEGGGHSPQSHGHERDMATDTGGLVRGSAHAHVYAREGAPPPEDAPSPLGSHDGSPAPSTSTTCEECGFPERPGDPGHRITCTRWSDDAAPVVADEGDAA